MFTEVSEDIGIRDEEETPISINKKTVDITKRLSNIFNLEDDEENNIPIIKKPETKKMGGKYNIIENIVIEKPKINTNEINTQQNIKNIIQPIYNKIKETKNFNGPYDEDTIKIINSQASEPNKEEKSNLKPDLNKLNKLFLAEEEDELDFKNINFKKEEKRIMNPQAKELQGGSDVVKNLKNLTTQRNEKFKNDENEIDIVKKNLIIGDNDKYISEEKSATKFNKETKSNKNDLNLTKNNKNSSNIINFNDSSNKNNTSIENQNKNKIENVDRLIGEPLPIKKESGNKKNSIKSGSDPLSMIESSVQKKNKNDPLSSTKNNIIENIITENQKNSEEINKNKINIYPENKTISQRPINEKIDIVQEVKEKETKPSKKVSDISKVIFQ
jgi:hypothetical protein